MRKETGDLYKLRQNILAVVDGLTLDELNEVPKGFNNNIIWNLAHMVAAQQGVCYRRAGLPMLLEEKFLSEFMPGTKPEKFYDQDFVDQTKQNLLKTIDQFDEDLKNQAFGNYEIWTTRYGVEIKNIEDMLQFLFFHEGLHSGYIMALKRAIRKD